MKLPRTDSEPYRLMTRFPRGGRVQWIGLRPVRDVGTPHVGDAAAAAPA